MTRHRNNLSSKLHAYSYNTGRAPPYSCALRDIILSRRWLPASRSPLSLNPLWSRGLSRGAQVQVDGRIRRRVMSEQQSSRYGGGTAAGSSSRQKITSALQVIRKNSVYRSIVTRLGNAVDTPKKCKKSLVQQPTVAATPTDDGGFGDWRTEGLPEHSHRRPSPPCVVSRSASDYGVVRSSARKQHSSDTKRVEEAYRRGFCDGSVADVFLIRQTAAVQQQLQQPMTASGRRRRPSSVDYTDGSPWTRLSSSSTVPAGLGCGGGDRIPSKSRIVSNYTGASAAAVVVQHRSLPSASRFQRHRRLSLPVSSEAGDASYYSSQSSIDMESPSATVPTKAAAIALHQLIECYRNGYRVTDHKIALMLDILDTQQRLAKVKFYWFFSTKSHVCIIIFVCKIYIL